MLINKATKDAQTTLYNNSIDPFSAIFDAMTKGITVEDWLLQESRRQVQKTMQNAIGDFHQNILGAVSGWENWGRGQVVDLLSTRKKIIAEVKNKFNTTKGNDKVATYDRFKNILKSRYKGFVSYYVEIIPKSKKIYDKEFVPSDNLNKTRRVANKSIRITDGISFYALVTGRKQALRELYLVLPEVIAQIVDKPEKLIADKEQFIKLFNSTYQ